MQIIKFSSLWCPACLIMNSRYNKIANTYHIPITDYDYDMDTDKVEEYHIGNILPEIILLDENNQEIERIIGELSEKKLNALIESRINHE